MKLNTKHFSILLGIMVFTVSCKKDNQITEPNISEITQKLRTNTAMGELVMSLIYDRDENHTYSNANLKDKDKVESYKNLIKQAKSREEIISIFNSAGINNSKALVDKMYFQNTKMVEIYKSVPELKLLSVEERTKMFSELLKEFFLQTRSIKSQKFTGNIKFPNDVKVMGCYHNFNKDWSGCNMAYNYEMLAIWFAVLSGSTFTGEIALAPLVGTGFALSGVAYLAREYCFNVSIASLSFCTDTLTF